MITSTTSPSRGLLRDCENRWIVCSSSLYPWLTWLRCFLLVTWISCHPSPISPGTRTIHDMGSRDFHNNKSCVFLWCRFWPSHQDVNPAPFTTHIGSRAKGDLHKTLSWNIITIFTGIMPSNQRPILEKIHSTKLYHKCVLSNKNL